MQVYFNNVNNVNNINKIRHVFVYSIIPVISSVFCSFLVLYLINQEIILDKLENVKKYLKLINYL